jgi:hypothetical protein
MPKYLGYFNPHLYILLMSDFFTKKQKKFWCEDCKIFIEYTAMSIEQHKRSKKHQQMINRDQAYKNTKNRIMKHINYMKDEPSDGNMLSQKTTREEFGNFFLDEIKKEKMKEELLEKTGKKSKNLKKWGVFWDVTHDLPYYHNFITKESQWDKPDDYDGPEPEVPKKNEGSTEGIIGKWETVEPNKSIYGKRSTKEELLPGEVTKEDYINIYKYKQEEPTGTIDDYILQDDNKHDVLEENKIINLTVDDVVDINEKLKKYVKDDTTYTDLSQIKKSEHKEEKISISFKQVKKNNKSFKFL